MAPNTGVCVCIKSIVGGNKVIKNTKFHIFSLFLKGNSGSNFVFIEMMTSTLINVIDLCLIGRLKYFLCLVVERRSGPTL